MGELTAASTRAAVQRYLAALNAHDADAVAGCVSADFVNEHTAALGRTVVGRSRYRSRLDGFLAEFVDLRYEVEELLADGDRAAVAYRMSFRLASAGRAPVRIRGVFRFRVDPDGLIAHRVDYWDSGEVHRQLADATDPPPVPGSGAGGPA
ncbi:nuclear transport factor 2 family protein [Micromonospora sp. WMMD714]|uniref:nuclear transport factor 2 family protein n=1 Tax=Micromonospora sp. WMMD714 TaxID=3016097 RepID=UPI00249ABB0E|nr:nuclear transport factor 2 family protein [Micromonospora sp. WMMD714]WFE65318.1 nuclear transport factor 2 family protein [Micromonospora sp. WMMD714]